MVNATYRNLSIYKLNSGLDLIPSINKATKRKNYREDKNIKTQNGYLSSTSGGMSKDTEARFPAVGICQ